MRIAEADALRFRKPEPRIERHRVFLAFLLRGNAVQHRPFGVLVDQPVGRVEAGGRGLRDIGDAPAEQAALLLGRGRDQIDAVELDGAAGNTAAVAGEPHRRQADRGLAGAGFADQPQHLASREIEVDAVHDRQPVFACKAFDLEVPDRRQRAGRCSSVGLLASVLQARIAVEHPVHGEVDGDGQEARSPPPAVAAGMPPASRRIPHSRYRSTARAPWCPSPRAAAGCRCRGSSAPRSAGTRSRSAARTPPAGVRRHWAGSP